MKKVSRKHKKYEALEMYGSGGLLDGLKIGDYDLGPALSAIKLMGGGNPVSTIRGIFSGAYQDMQSNSGMVNKKPVTQNQENAFISTLDPRMQHFANGGNIVELPKYDGPTDSIPTDAQGNPAIASGQQPIAMTDSGEIVWNGYVFSDKLGYAQKAKNILRRYRLRGGTDFSGLDRISKTQMDSEFANLADEQELYKSNNQIDEPSEGYATGGSIHIKPSKVGTFTAAANRHKKGVQEFASHVLAHKENFSPAMVKKANFAKNASSWNHKWGGGDLLDDGFDYKFKPGFESTFPNVQGLAEDALLNPYDSFRKDDRILPSVDIVGHPIHPRGEVPNMLQGRETGLIPNTFAQPKLAKSMYASPTEITPSNPLDPDMAALLGNIGTAGLQGLVALSARQKNFSPSTYPVQKMNLSMERDDLERQAITQRRSLLNRYRDNRAAQIAGVTSVDENLASGMSKSYMNQEQYNANAMNQQRQFTAISKDKMKEMKEAERGAVAGSISNMIGNVGGAFNQYFGDKAHRAQDDNMMEWKQGGMNYRSIKLPDGTWYVPEVITR